MTSIVRSAGKVEGGQVSSCGRGERVEWRRGLIRAFEDNFHVRLCVITHL